MPLNSGDNSISNTLIEKFMALTPTQYFLLHQWAEGTCVSRRDDPELGPGLDVGESAGHRCRRQRGR